MPNDSATSALAPIVRKELARRKLLDFAKLVYPRFDDPPHIRLIAELLEGIEVGTRRRLAVAVPVRHGKSVLGSQLFAAWYLGRNPGRNIILASHSEELAVRNSRIAKNLVEDSRWPFDVRLATDSSAAGRWNTKEGGGCYAVGCGGAITGRGADLLVIDDALHDGLSETEKTTVFRWYSEVAIPRLEPGGAVIVIGARFAQDDLLGRILESDDGRNWAGNIVNLPAIAESDDVLGRKPGDALWPERFSLEELDQRRVSMGSRAFESQFQQKPVSYAGDMFKREWFVNRFDDEPLRNPPPYAPSAFSNHVRMPPPLDVILSVDTASKDGVGNDYSVLATLACDGRRFYILDIVRERLQFADLLRAIMTTFRKQRPRFVVIEGAASGYSVVQEIRRGSAVPVHEVPARGSKISRADAASPMFEGGQVLLPRIAPWVEALVDEFCAFPGGRHDDMVDAVCQGLSILQSRQRAAVVRAQQTSARWRATGSWLGT